MPHTRSIKVDGEKVRVRKPIEVGKSEKVKKRICLGIIDDIEGIYCNKEIISTKRDNRHLCDECHARNKKRADCGSRFEVMT